jgi:hypothetical protein
VTEDKKLTPAKVAAQLAPDATGAMAAVLTAVVLAPNFWAAPFISAGVSVATRVGFDFSGHRRAKRARASLIEGIKLRLQANETPRADLLDTGSGRPVVLELLEGAMRAARDDCEDRKAEHYGRSVVNYVFMPSVSSADAHALRRIAERLTWRQWLILEWVRRGECAPIKADPSRSQTAAAARQEFQELVSGDLVDLTGTADGAKQPSLTPMGASIAELLGLDGIEPAEIRRLMADVSEGLRANPPSSFVTM